MLTRTAIVVVAAAAACLNVGVSAQQACNATVSTNAVATLNNATHYNGCVKGATWKLTNLFDAWKLSPEDLTKFCLEHECLDPMHGLLHSVPKDCVIEFAGKPTNVSEQVAKLHDKCHEIKDAKGQKHAGGSMAGSGHAHTHGSSVGSAAGRSDNVAKTPSAAPVPSKSSSAASTKLAVVAIVGALTLASLSL